MPGPTKAPVATRYFQPETTLVYILPSVADLHGVGPTRAELNAGVDVTADISGISGFSVSTAQIATPDAGKRFTSSIPGRITAEDSSIMFYASKDGEDVRQVIVRDVDYVVVILDGGDVPGGPMDVFDTTCGSVGKARDLEDAPKLNASFTIRDYEENLVVPALT